MPRCATARSAERRSTCGGGTRTQPSRNAAHRVIRSMKFRNVIMTPHCSGWTEGMVARRWAEVAGNINRFVRGEPLQNVVVTT